MVSGNETTNGLFPSLSQGFDEYMNLVLDDAEEVHMKTKNRKPLGKSPLFYNKIFSVLTDLSFVFIFTHFIQN